MIFCSQTHKSSHYFQTPFNYCSPELFASGTWDHKNDLHLQLAVKSYSHSEVGPGLYHTEIKLIFKSLRNSFLTEFFTTTANNYPRITCVKSFCIRIIFKHFKQLCPYQTIPGILSSGVNEVQSKPVKNQNFMVPQCTRNIEMSHQTPQMSCNFQIITHSFISQSMIQSSLKYTEAENTSEYVYIPRCSSLSFVSVTSRYILTACFPSRATQ